MRIILCARKEHERFSKPTAERWEGIRAAIRRIRKKARLEEQGKNYFILCILGTLLIIHQIIK